MSTVRTARPSCNLPPLVEVRGIRYQLKVKPGPLLVNRDGFWTERHYVVDHDRREFHISDKVPADDRRYVLGRALIAENS